MRFLLLIPWGDLAESDDSAFKFNVAYRFLDAQSIEEAQRLVEALRNDERALFDVIKWPGAAQDEVGDSEEVLDEHGASVGEPLLLPFALLEVIRV